MTEKTEAANADTSPPPPPVEGFFAPKTPVNSGSPELFKRFQLDPASWDEFQRKIAQPQGSSSVPRRLKVVPMRNMHQLFKVYINEKSSLELENQGKIYGVAREMDQVHV
ncbi:hypothetical protein P3T76_008360 [Phytophthora citrophthora]|uniref:Uncharacterized protein n=1 Tax=Phytophthora citrophthora TaxID=4793 RepID=A0AAD9GK68_9STRA|nr:hypothetical protein P3T76_008360 [Phytophthora citrophthora]